MSERQHSLACPYPEGCTCGASEHNRIVAGSENTARLLAGLLAKHDQLRESVRRLVGTIDTIHMENIEPPRLANAIEAFLAENKEFES